VNEEVRSVFAVSSEDKAQWEATRAERRLEEAATLAVKGRLTDEYRIALAARFEKHADASLENTEILEEKNSSVALDVVSGFEARLAAHQTLLEGLNGESKSVLASLRAKVERVIAVRLRAESRLAAAATPPGARGVERATFKAAETMMMQETANDTAATLAPEAEADSSSGSIEMTLSEPAVPFEVLSQAREASQKSYDSASLLFERMRGKLSEEHRSEAVQLLTAVEQAQAEGLSALEVGEEHKALEYFRTSFSLSQRLVVYLKAAARLVDVRITLPETFEPLKPEVDRVLDPVQPKDLDRII
jgi:hypothetical protein